MINHPSESSVPIYNVHKLNRKYFYCSLTNDRAAGDVLSRCVGGASGPHTELLCERGQRSDVSERVSLLLSLGHGLSDGRLVRPQPHCHQLHHYGEYRTDRDETVRDRLWW